MSKERELLKQSIEMIKIVPMMSSIGNVPPDFASELILEIQELLAQPEQRLTPLTSKLISLGNNCHKYFLEGIRFAEKMHGIGVEHD